MGGPTPRTSLATAGAQQRQRAAEEQQRRAELEAIRSEISKQQDQLANYTQLILLLGYGGFFTLWIQTRPLMSLWLFGWTGSMLTFSLLLFICWELARAYLQGINLPKLAAGKISVVEYRAVHRKNGRFWKPVFLSTVVSGLAGGVPLLLWYVYTMIRAAAAWPAVLPGPGAG